VKLRAFTDSNYSYYPVIFESEKDLLKVQKSLNQKDIYPRGYFYPSLNTLNYVNRQPMSNSEPISSRILCLPLYVGIHEQELITIATLINQS